MKKTYSAPALTDIRLNCSSFFAISGGGKGNEGDNAESRQFWGNTIFDDDTDDTSESDFLE